MNLKPLITSGITAAMILSLSGCLSGDVETTTGATSAAPATTIAEASAPAAPAAETAQVTTAEATLEEAPAATIAASSTDNSSFAAATTFPHGSCLLWKPTSEIDHGLVVLVPASMGNATPIIKRENGEVFARGREHGAARGHNICGGQIRYHYIFGKGPGASYPKNVTLNIGSNSYKIPNPAARFE